MNAISICGSAPSVVHGLSTIVFIAGNINREGATENIMRAPIPLSALESLFMANEEIEKFIEEHADISSEDEQSALFKLKEIEKKRINIIESLDCVVKLEHNGLRDKLLNEGFDEFEFCSYEDFGNSDSETFIFYFHPGRGWKEKLEEIKNLKETKDFGEVVFTHNHMFDCPATHAGETFWDFVANLKFNKDYFVSDENNIFFLEECDFR